MSMHTHMNRFCFLVLTLLVFGCGEKKAMEDTSGFEAMSGWVLISNGSVEDIRAAILDYDSLVREETPGKFLVEIHQQKEGGVAVLFPDGLPSYDMANITVWLDAPPEQQNVYDAKAWVRPPNESKKYFLRPEVENEWGDTLVGSNTKGKSIRVYVPETGISEISQTIEYETEPEVLLNPNPVRITITLDTEISWANPKFSINKPLNHIWNN